MPEIDDLVVRLDADLRPLDRSLRQAMTHLERFSEKAERELRPVFEQLDAIVERSGLPEAQAAFSRATEANAAALTAQLDAFSRQVALQLGPLLGQVLIGLSTSVGGSAIYDRLCRGDQGLLKRIVPEQRGGT